MSRPTAKTPVSIAEIKMGEGAGRGKGLDPFKDPRNRLTLPSAIRTFWIDKILTWFKEGEIIANK